MNEKYPGLKFVAAILNILAWMVLAIGFISSIFLGIAASTAAAKIYMLVGGFIVTAISCCALFAFSRLINLLIDIESEIRGLSEVRHALDKKDKTD